MYSHSNPRFTPLSHLCKCTPCFLLFTSEPILLPTSWLLETWTMRKHERRKIDAFELWCWRRVLRVSWMERKTNISIIESIKPEWTLESRVTKADFGHVVRAGGMEDDMMLGRMNANGARKRGRPRQRWVDILKGYASGATISNMRRDARERAG